MLAAILAFYYYGSELVADRGPITAAAVDTVTFPALAGTTSPGNQLPVGAAEAARPRDPSDRAPLALDFSALLGDGVEIDEIVSLTMSAAGNAAGITIDEATPRLPIIEEDGGQRIQIWLGVAEGSRNDTAFLGAGLKVGVAALIRTNEDAYREYERTGVATFRQL